MEIDWQEFINNPQGADAEVLAAMLREYPYFVWPALLSLEKNVNEPEEAQKLRAMIALAVGDRQALANVLDPETDFADFYPDMHPVKLSTNDTIDAFLDRFGTGNDKETDLLTRMIFDTTPSEHLTLEDSEETASSDNSGNPENLGNSGNPENLENLGNPDSSDKSDSSDLSDLSSPDSTASRIDAFLAVSKQPARVPEALKDLVAETRPEESYPAEQPAKVLPSAKEEPVVEEEKQASRPDSLTLSLAKMMIKNRNYNKALEIISRLNLENPEKSTYFADQIRFLKKLIIIQQHNQQ